MTNLRNIFKVWHLVTKIMWLLLDTSACSILRNLVTKVFMITHNNLVLFSFMNLFCLLLHIMKSVRMLLSQLLIFLWYYTKIHWWLTFKFEVKLLTRLLLLKLILWTCPIAIGFRHIFDHNAARFTAIFIFFDLFWGLKLYHSWGRSYNSFSHSLGGPIWHHASILRCVDAQMKFKIAHWLRALSQGTFLTGGFLSFLIKLTLSF